MNIGKRYIMYQNIEVFVDPHLAKAAQHTFCFSRHMFKVIMHMQSEHGSREFKQFTCQ